MKHTHHKSNYCKVCGYKTSEKDIDGTPRQYCNNCEYVAYIDPKLVAVAIVSNEKQELLLVKRNIEPAIGKWAFPSGYVDSGEAVEDAVVREAKEETNLDIVVEKLIGVYSNTGNPIILIVYSATHTGGNLHPGIESQEVRWFNLNDLPKLPFPHDNKIIDDWHNLYSAPQPTD
jgi:mutator protein MutT